MTGGVEEKACLILESLSCHLSDGRIDYECENGEHRFLIERAGAKFSVRFPEERLLRKKVDELTLLVHRLVKEVRMRTAEPAKA